MGVLKDSEKRIRDGAIALAQAGMSEADLRSPSAVENSAIDAVTLLSRFASAVIDLAVFRRVQLLSQAGKTGRPPELYEALKAAHDFVGQWFVALGLPYTDI